MATIVTRKCRQCQNQEQLVVILDEDERPIICSACEYQIGRVLETTGPFRIEVYVARPTPASKAEIQLTRAQHELDSFAANPSEILEQPNLVDAVLRSDVEQAWSCLLDDYQTKTWLGKRGGLPAASDAALPGALYARSPSGDQIAVVLADCLADAVRQLRSEWTNSDIRANAFYTVGARDELIKNSRIVRQARSALARGRARDCKNKKEFDEKAENIPGVYRITGHLQVDTTIEKQHLDGVTLIHELPAGSTVIYVGRSAHMRTRLQQHSATDQTDPRKCRISYLGGWDNPNGVTSVTLHKVKQSGQSQAWTQVQLLSAEQYHIEKAESRYAAGEGPFVINDAPDSRGKTGKQPAHYYVWPP